MKKILFVIAAISILTSCTGEEVGSDNPPKVSGKYSCVNSCNETCVFSTLNVNQNKSQVIATSPYSNCTGTVNNNGEYYAECKGSSVEGTCNGVFVNGTFTTDCIIGDLVCQRAVFKKQ